MTDCAAPRHDAQDEPTEAAQHGPGGDGNDCIQPPAPHAPHRYHGTDAIVPNAGEDDDDDYAECSWCGGEWYLQECDDPIQCCSPRCDGQWHPCDACQGTGLAKHQVMW